MSRKKFDMHETMDKLKHGIQNIYNNSETYKDYLTVMSKFYKYSAANCLLIMMQRPK